VKRSDPANNMCRLTDVLVFSHLLISEPRDGKEPRSGDDMRHKALIAKECGDSRTEAEMGRTSFAFLGVPRMLGCRCPFGRARGCASRGGGQARSSSGSREL
jgi:hypothetical protein